MSKRPAELYCLKKNAEDIEAVMSSAYRLYEGLPEEEEELKKLGFKWSRIGIRYLYYAKKIH